MNKLTKYLIYEVINYLDFTDILNTIFINKIIYNDILNYKCQSNVLLFNNTSITCRTLKKIFLDYNWATNITDLNINNCPNIDKYFIEFVINKYKLITLQLTDCYGIQCDIIKNKYNIPVIFNNYLHHINHSNAFRLNSTNLIITQNKELFLKNLIYYFSKSSIIILNAMIYNCSNLKAYFNPNDTTNHIHAIHNIYTILELSLYISDIIRIQKRTYTELKIIHNKILIICIPSSYDFQQCNLDLYIQRCNRYNITIYCILYEPITINSITKNIDFMFIDNKNYNRFVHNYYIQSTNKLSSLYNTIKLALYKSRLLFFNLNCKGSYPKLVFLK
jgi:hypothetical protein